MRSIAPAFSYCLIFANANNRDDLSDIWHFHLECQKAVHNASEQLLGMIRLQWLIDTIENKISPAGFGLMCRIAQADRLGAICIEIAKFWQQQFENQAENAQRRDENCTAFTLLKMAEFSMGKLTEIQRETVENIGKMIAQSQQGKVVQNQIIPAQIKTHFGRGEGWLIALHFVINHAQHRNPNTDNLLIFRLCWHVFKHLGFK